MALPLEVAYVGNLSDELFMGGQTISGSGFGSFTDQNKTPLGAFFLPDPLTGITSTDPENINQSSGFVNHNSDYHPYAKEYGSNQILVNSHVGYSNYNALQVSWVKRSDRLTFNANFTWSKNLGTGLQIDPYTVHGNYGVLSNDRPYVVNTSFDYNFLKLYHGENKLIGGAANGWTISKHHVVAGGRKLAGDQQPELRSVAELQHSAGVQHRTFDQPLTGHLLRYGRRDRHHADHDVQSLVGTWRPISGSMARASLHRRSAPTVRAITNT